MFNFGTRITAHADSRMTVNRTSANLWKNCSFGCSELTFEEGDEFTFIIGEVKAPALEEKSEYAISVTEKGVAVRGKDYGSLLRGFSVLCMKIGYNDLHKGSESLYIPDMEYQGKYKIENRMIHFCIFPETDFEYIRKYIRLAGILQYTHVVIEYWGMIKYDSVPYLAWDNAFTKEQGKILAEEIRGFGMEPIPMFNQFGHASASRLCTGKHVVLDRHPELQHLFTPDGWSWDITSDEVFDMLKKARQELCEVCGEGEYFHIGCDEAFMYTKSEELRKPLPAYLKRLTDEVVKEGRKPMMWMDMCLPSIDDGYFAFAKDDEAESLLESLNPETIAVDWQYDIGKTPIKSSLYLKDKGCTVIGAPWYDYGNISAHINTICENNLFGIMLTTWHTLSNKITSILNCAKKCGAVTFDWSSIANEQSETATLLRKTSFETLPYEMCGWTKQQIEL